MSKKSVNKIANPSSTLAVLLEKLQNRITSSYKRVTDVEDRLDLIEAVLPYGPGDGTHLASQTSVYELDKKVDAITTNAAKGFVEQKQALADNAAGTSYALESLKTSTQRAFDGVSNDMKSATDCAQRHNARISKLEGGIDAQALESVGIRIVQASFDDRLARLESKGIQNGTLEEDLKAVLVKHGYDVSAIGITNFAPLSSVIGWSNMPASKGSVKVELTANKK